MAAIFLPVVLCDLDAAFLGFELLRRPELRGRPVVVGGSPEARGVVATASYEARAFGVRSAMSAAEARRRCPSAVFLPVDMPYYREMSARFVAAATEGVAVCEPVGLDEVYLDLSGQERAFPDTAAFAEALRGRVWQAVGVSCSVGGSVGRALAKLACELRAKPGGIALLPAADAPALLAPQPVDVLPGIGRQTGTWLRHMGIATCADLARLPRPWLARRLGPRGGEVWDLLRGVDRSRVAPRGAPRSLSVEETFADDLGDEAEARAQLARLAWELGRRLAADGLAPRQIGVRWRTPDFRDHSRQRTFAQPVGSRLEIRDAVLALWRAREGPGPRPALPVRLLGVQAGGLQARAAPLLPADRLEQVLGALEAGGMPLLPASLCPAARRPGPGAP